MHRARIHFPLDASSRALSRARLSRISRNEPAALIVPGIGASLLLRFLRKLSSSRSTLDRAFPIDATVRATRFGRFIDR